MPIPDHPKIYHIVHVDNLASIVADGYLWPDSLMVKRNGGTVVGMQSIKRRRLKLPVSCHPQTFVGDYVPFYLCPRSVMLYVISRGNHPNLAYKDGQGPVVHLMSDMREVVAWATANSRRWAFSLSNAGAYYTQFRNDLSQLEEINWDAVAARDFRSADIKEAKQAEFLMHESFPWELVKGIGVHSESIGARAITALGNNPHRPQVKVKKEWYY